MHEYLMSIKTYYGETERFMVVARDKNEALEKAKNTPFYLSITVIQDTLKCIRQLKPSFGEGK